MVPDEKSPNSSDGLALDSSTLRIRRARFHLSYSSVTPSCDKKILMACSNSFNQLSVWIFLFFTFLIPVFLTQTTTVLAEALDEGEVAWSYHLRGQHERAIGAAEEILSRIPNHVRATSVLLISWLEEDQEESVRNWIDKCTEHPSSAGNCLIGEAIFAAHTERLTVADSLWTSALDWYVARGDSLGELVTREQMALGMIVTGRSQEAIVQLERVAILAENQEQELALAFVHLNMGRAQVRTRQMEEATAHLQTALAEATRLEAFQWQGDAAIALSVISRLRMDLDEAMSFRQDALIAYEKAGSVSGQARSRHYIATIHIFRGELTQAMGMLQNALALAREAKAADVESGCLGDLAGLNYLLGDFERATKLYQEALRLIDNPHRRGWIQVNLGSILAFQGRHEEALSYYQGALTVMREVGDVRTEAKVLQGIGQSYCELEEYSRGLARLDEAVALAREASLPMEEAYALHFKGHGLLDQGQLEEATEALDEASRIAENTGYFDILESTYLGQAMVARARGDHETALKHLEEAVAVIMAVRRLSGGSTSVQSGYFSQAGKSFSELVDLLYEMHQEAPQRGLGSQAFHVAQTAKARSFLDLLAEAEVDLRCRAEVSYQERETELLSAIAAQEQRKVNAPSDSVAYLEAEMTRLENQLDLLEAQLREADPRYTELRYPQPCTMEEAQQKVLVDGELLLEFYLGSKASYVWAVSPTSFGFYQLPPREEIETQVHRLLPMLQDFNLLGEHAGYYVPAARQLYLSLLAPAAAEIATARRLVIAPDGILHYLPYEALLSDEYSGQDFADLPYLVHKVDIAYVPSLTTLTRLRVGSSQSASFTEMLLVGDPSLPTADEGSVFAQVAGATSLAPVPYVAEEMAGVMAMIPAERCRVLRGGDASLTAVRLACSEGPYRYVHFATHGLFNEHRPQYSGLVLSPDRNAGDDGFLATAEIFALDLECDQVVLSACSSALGERIDGEGVVGLTRAFMYAGARSVIAALWDVPGSSTATFMSDFYNQIATTRAGDRIHALAETKRRMICGAIDNSQVNATTAHPTFWAAFVFNGDGD